MTTKANLMQALKDLSDASEGEHTITEDKDYNKKALKLMKDSISKGSDVMQLADGSIHVTETKIVTYQYLWNNNKKRFERFNNTMRNKKLRDQLEHQEHISFELNNMKPVKTKGKVNKGANSNKAKAEEKELSMAS